MLTWLADALRAEGCHVKEVDGWKQRQRPAGGTLRPVGIINHHTVKSNLATITKGRGAPDPLPGPLANLYLTKRKIDMSFRGPLRDQIAARLRGGAGLPPPVPKFSGTLRPGATGERVRQVQRNLNKFLPPAEKLSVNGTFDGPTETKLREWQTTRLFKPASIGVVGPGTWEMLFAPRFSKNLQLNPVSKGTAVRQLKHALNQYRGNDLDTTKEVFDGPTKTAVENWQHNRRQRKDGIVDMVTWYWIHAPHLAPEDVPNLHPS